MDNKNVKMNFGDIKMPEPGEEWDLEEYKRMKIRNREIQRKISECDKELGFGILKIQCLTREQRKALNKKSTLRLSDECECWKEDFDFVYKHFPSDASRLAFFLHHSLKNIAIEVSQMKLRTPCILHVFTYTEEGYAGLRAKLDELRSKENE